MADRKVIFISGISGSGTRNFAAAYEQALPGRVKVYHTGDLVTHFAQPRHGSMVPKENVLNIHPRLLEEHRWQAYDFVLRDMNAPDNRAYDRIIVDGHAQFLWNNVFTNAFDLNYLNMLSPDLFVTIIDRPSAIRERQMEGAQGRSQRHGIERILLWQNVEVNVTQALAQVLGKPSYVLPSRQSPLTAESLLQSAFLIYLSMPMTYVSKEGNAAISVFKERLEALGCCAYKLPTPVIDPRHIDLEPGPYSSKRELNTNEDQTVHRDLNWYISAATDVVIVYPKGRGGISLGVSHEQMRAFESGRHVSVDFPQDRVSPFMRVSSKVFKTEEQFFSFFRRHMQQAYAAHRRGIAPAPLPYPSLYDEHRRG